MIGAAEVSEHFHRVASRFTDLREFRFELIAADVHGDAAYSVGFEHFLGSFDGRAARGVAGDIAGDEYRLCAGLRGEPDGLSLRPAGPDHQVAAPGAQPRAQIGEALQHEAGPVRRGHQPGVYGERGATKSACPHAAARAGLSRTRRSRVNSTIAVVIVSPSVHLGPPRAPVA